MYRILVLEPEQREREALCALVDWRRLGCEVFAAGQAGEAAALMKKQNPGVLITDPEGFSLAASLRQSVPELQLIVRTAEPDFAAAQQAVRLGAIRLLLKSAPAPELEEAVLSALGRLSPQEDAQELNVSSSIVNRAMGYMAANYRGRLTLQEVADYCFVSQWHLSKLLNRHLDKKFYDILNELRIQKAKELLRDPALRIGRISEQVGYADTAHFARSFKKYAGMSANEYRNSLK